MAISDILPDSIKSAVQAYESRGLTNVMEGALNASAARNYPFSYDVFPEDLGSSYYGHFMTITAIQRTGPYTGAIGNNISNNPQHSQYAVAFFIPSAESGSGIIYSDKHEYADIKLANLMGGAIGALPFGQEAVKLAAAGASLLGHPINPGVQILYRNTNLRQFQFTFLMAPQSEKESTSLKNIVKRLRMFAAPELNEKSYLFNTPCEFEIKFYNKGQENENIPKIRRCVLTDIIADFTPQGEWSTFRNGHPVACQLSLAFQEMEIIHRDFIKDGW